MDDSDFKQTIEAIKLRAPVEDVVRERVPGLRRSGALWVACCPFHEEKTPSFKVDPRRGTWHCFGACSIGGDVISFVERFDRVEFRDAVEILAARAGLEPPRWGRGQREGESGEAGRLFEALAWAEAFYRRTLAGNEGQRARDYLRERGLETGAVEAFALGFAPAGGEVLVAAARRTDHTLDDLKQAGLARVNDRGRPYDFFRGRLMIPIRDAKGRTVGFGGRTLDKGPKAGPKYVNTPDSPVFHKGQLVYGLDRAMDAVRREGHLVLVEGYTDVIAAHQVGLGTAAAVLGTATTEDHARIVRRSGARRVSLVFDGDEAGRRATWRALHGLLPLGVALDVVTPPPGQDPCDLLVREGADGLRRELDSASDWFPALVEYLVGLEGPARLEEVDRLLELIAQLSRPLERDQRLSELAAALDYPVQGVREAYESLPQRRRAAAAEREAPAPTARTTRGPRQRRARRAWGELAGAAILDNSLLPLVRPHADRCPEADVGAVLRALAGLADEGRHEVDASTVMTALGEEAARQLVVPIVEHAAAAEDARDLLEGALRTLRELELEESVEEGMARLSHEGDEQTVKRQMAELHDRLRAAKVPSAQG